MKENNIEKITVMKDLEILYEDNHIIAVNKQISDIVQEDPSGDTPLSEKVKAYIKEKYNKPGDVFLGIPHRVDRPVSGVVLFAKTSKALVRLNKMFQERDEEIKRVQSFYQEFISLIETNEKKLILKALTDCRTTCSIPSSGILKSAKQ